MARTAMYRGFARGRFYLNRVEVPGKGLHVSYGGHGNRASPELLHGGRVKLNHLLEEFPESLDRTNILYIVSSALPQNAEEMIEWAKRWGIRIVLNQNGVGYSGWAGDDYKRINEKLSFFHERADFIIYQSEFCRSSAEYFLRARNCPFDVLFNCVDTNRFIPPPGTPDMSTWHLLAIGTHQQRERVTVPLQVVSMLKSRGHNVKLTIAGRLDWPNGDQEVDDLIGRLGLNADVELVSRFSQQEAPEIYRASHVLVHLKYKDPCPSVVIEALSCGLPVIGSESGGMTELVSDEAGILLAVPETWDAMPAPGAESVADAVVQIMSKRRAYSESARRWARDTFNHREWVSRHREIFKELIENPHPD